MLDQQKVSEALISIRAVKLDEVLTYVNHTCTAVIAPIISNCQLIASFQHLFILFNPLSSLCAQIYLAPTLPYESKKHHSNQRMKFLRMYFVLPATCILRSSLKGQLIKKPEKYWITCHLKLICGIVVYLKMKSSFSKIISRFKCNI